MKKTAMIMAAAAACVTMPLASTVAFAKDGAASDESTSPDNKIRCRKLTVIGSLVKKTKVCRTVAEWRAITDKGNRNARDVVESGQSCAGGPDVQRQLSEPFARPCPGASFFALSGLLH